MTGERDNTLEAVFIGGGDARSDMEVVVYDSGPLHAGTRLMASHVAGAASYLEIIRDAGQSVWEAEWHDGRPGSKHDGALFRILLVPPVEYEDDRPVRRAFRLEQIGEREIAGPWVSTKPPRPA